MALPPGVRAYRVSTCGGFTKSICRTAATRAHDLDVTRAHHLARGSGARGARRSTCGPRRTATKRAHNLDVTRATSVCGRDVAPPAVYRRDETQVLPFCYWRSSISVPLSLVGRHLAAQKTPPPRTLHQPYAQGPRVDLRETALSYERGTPVHSR
jgi:hypothetical protein